LACTVASAFGVRIGLRKSHDFADDIIDVVERGRLRWCLLEGLGRLSFAEDFAMRLGTVMKRFVTTARRRDVEGELRDGSSACCIVKTKDSKKDADSQLHACVQNEGKAMKWKMQHDTLATTGDDDEDHQCQTHLSLIKGSKKGRPSLAKRTGRPTFQAFGVSRCPKFGWSKGGEPEFQVRLGLADPTTQCPSDENHEPSRH